MRLLELSRWVADERAVSLLAGRPVDPATAAADDGASVGTDLVDLVSDRFDSASRSLGGLLRRSKAGEPSDEGDQPPPEPVSDR